MITRLRICFCQWLTHKPTAQISMNVQVAHPTTVIRKQTVIILMVHFTARVRVVTVGTVSATATVC